MTVCIAAVCDGGKKIVVAADRMFTAGAPINLEFETSEKKIETLSPSCAALFAGNSAFATEILHGALGTLAGVPLAQELKQRRQLLPPFSAGAGHLLGPHHSAAGGGERGMLDRQVLVDRRNASVSVDHDAKCLKTVDVDWITYRNSRVNGFETRFPR
jgi:hypothetical protein